MLVLEAWAWKQSRGKRKLPKFARQQGFKCHGPRRYKGFIAEERLFKERLAKALLKAIGVVAFLND